MKEFLLHYWIEFLFGTIIGLLTQWTATIHHKLKKKQEEEDALKGGVISLLHDRLFQACTFYLELGYIPVDKAEEIMDNVEMLYNAYHGLGGNGTGTAIYNKFQSLHIKREEVKENENEQSNV